MTIILLYYGNLEKDKHRIGGVDTVLTTDNLSTLLKNA